MTPFERDLLALYPKMRRWGIALAGPFDGLDLAQDCYVRCLERRHQFAAGTNLSAWAWSVLRSRWFMTCRRAERRYRSDVDVNEIVVAPAQEDTVYRKELLANVLRLRPEYADPIVLTCVVGLTYDEAASLIGIPLSTLKTRIWRGTTQLSELNL